MIRNLMIGTTTAVIVAACATAPVTEPAPESTAEPVVLTDDVTEFDLALSTADQLVEAGNTPTAIDRLTQLLGDDSLSEKERATLYFERGTLRHSASGHDLWGAISDFETVVDEYPSSPFVAEASESLGLARGEATSLNFVLEQPETTRSDRFNALFRLGEHQDAIDLMLASNLRPDNDHLIAMYQIGYLCDGEDQTGPAYPATEPDGTRRELRFCDFGK